MTEITVSIPGIYTLTVENPISGCTAEEAIEVSIDIAPPTTANNYFCKEDQNVLSIQTLNAFAEPCEDLLGNTIATPSICLLYTSPSPRDRTRSRMPSSA